MIDLPINENIIRKVSLTENINEITTDIKRGIKKGRGRHKLNCDCEKCLVKKNIQKVEPHRIENNDNTNTDFGDIDDDLKNRLSEFKEVKNNVIKTEGSPQTEVKTNNIKISGRLLITLMDVIIPIVLTMVINFTLLKGAPKKLNIEDIKMDSDERKDLEPIADMVAETITSKIDPLTLFLLIAGTIYGSKLMVVLPDLTKYKQNKKTNAK